jgi:hypothetical protein
VVDDWKSEQRRDFRRAEKDLRALLNEWDPIPGSPDDEYDCLIPQLYAQLRAGASSDQIEAFLTHELKHHFGLDPSPTADREVSTQLARWAQSREWPRPV